MPLIQWILNNLDSGSTTYTYSASGTIVIDGSFDVSKTITAEFDPDDIKFYLSGGVANKRPEKSIGGLPSNRQISDVVNNLFSQVTKNEMDDGSEIYRCFYIVNTGIRKVENVKIWIEQDDLLGEIYIGTKNTVEIQKLTISGSPTGGTFSLTYTGLISGSEITETTSDIDFVTDADELADNIQSALNELTLLTAATVTAQLVGDRYNCFISLSEDYKSFNLIEIESNDIIGDNEINIIVETPGSPINAIADNVGFQNQTPAEVIFIQPTEADPLEINDLDSMDAIGIWIKRVTEANSSANQASLDDVIIKFSVEIVD